MATTAMSSDVQVQRQFELLQFLFRPCGPIPFAVRFWDGSTIEPQGPDASPFTLVLNHVGAMRKMFWPPDEMVVTEAYVNDDFNVVGDMPAFIRIFRKMGTTKRSVGEQAKIAWRFWNLPAATKQRAEGRKPAKLTGKVHSKERDAAAISYHYDASNEFFELFLDSQMQYTCGAFADVDEDVETAQNRKLHYLCRKLRLKPGQRLLDIGCGWGGFVMFAAKNYGVEAFGATLSKQQALYAQEKIRQAGLQGRCRVEHLDYRDVPEDKLFDKVVTVCVLEHLGEKGITTYMQKVHRLLRPGGSAMIQQITLSRDYWTPLHRRFSDRYVFPDGELVPISTTLREAEKAGLEVRDVESLREHYPLTIKHWLRQLDDHHDEALAMTDEATIRVHKLYLAGAVAGYEDNVYNLHHTVLVKADNEGVSHYPLQRNDWYDAP